MSRDKKNWNKTGKDRKYMEKEDNSDESDFSNVLLKRCFWKFRKVKVFSSEFFEIFKNAFFHMTLPVTASEKLKAEAVF